MRHPRHLGGKRGHRLATAIGIVHVTGNIATKLVAEAVVTLARGDLRCHPERSAQPGIAVLRQLGPTAERAGLAGSEVEAAELQELAVMAEPPQVSGFGQDCQSVDRSDSRDPPQQPVVGMIGQRDLRDLFDPIALPDQARAWAIIIRNIVIAALSSGTGNAIDEQAVS